MNREDKLLGNSRRCIWQASNTTLLILLTVGALTATAALAQPAKDFNACALLTVEEASTLLGAPAVPETIKGKVPKVAPNCLYTSTVDGKPLALVVKFRFFKSPTEAITILKAERLEDRGRPLLINGLDAYWHPKLAYLVVSKGGAILTITVGPTKEGERVPELARKVADLLLPKVN